MPNKTGTKVHFESRRTPNGARRSICGLESFTISVSTIAAAVTCQSCLNIDKNGPNNDLVEENTVSDPAHPIKADLTAHERDMLAMLLRDALKRRQAVKKLRETTPDEKALYEHQQSIIVDLMVKFDI